MKSLVAGSILVWSTQGDLDQLCRSRENRQGETTAAPHSSLCIKYTQSWNGAEPATITSTKHGDSIFLGMRQALPQAACFKSIQTYSGGSIKPVRCCWVTCQISNTGWQRTPRQLFLLNNEINSSNLSSILGRSYTDGNLAVFHTEINTFVYEAEILSTGIL